MANHNSKQPQFVPGRCSVTHDQSLHEWRMKIRLEETRLWFLSVFVNENGTLDKYSLDEEAACDSHYEFINEKKIRRLLYEKGDENRYLHEIFMRYVQKYNGFKLVELIKPYITAQFHYD